MNFVAVPNGTRERDAELAAEVFLKFGDAFENLRLARAVSPFQIIQPDRKAALFECRMDPVEFRACEPAFGNSIKRIKEDSDRDRFAMRDLETGHGFELVGGPVAEVEGPGVAKLEGIAPRADMIEM